MPIRRLPSLSHFILLDIDVRDCLECSVVKSRVFLWSTIHKPEKPSSLPKTFKSRLEKLSPMTAMKMKAVLTKLINPATGYAHSISISIFDGDGIFLHSQGGRGYARE